MHLPLWLVILGGFLSLVGFLTTLIYVPALIATIIDAITE